MNLAADLRELGQWSEQAACVDGDPGAFFGPSQVDREYAKQVCGGCPVRVECLAYALDNDERFGVWGGKDERERRRIARRARAVTTRR